MLPSRVLRGEILTSDSMSRLSVEAEFLFWRLLLVADDYGRFDGRLDVIRAAVFPTRQTMTAKKIDRWLTELVEEGCLASYAVKDRPYLFLPGWEKHRSKAKRGESSKFPAPPEVEDAEHPGAGFVYFVQAETGGPIKIGWSTNPAARIEQLRNGNPEDLAILGVKPANHYNSERAIQGKFKHLKVRGEWYTPGDDLLEYIGAECAPADPRGSPRIPANAQPGGKVASGEYRVASDELDPPATAGSRPRSPKVLSEEVYPELRARAKRHGKTWPEKPHPDTLDSIAKRIRKGASKSELLTAIDGYVSLNGTEAREGFDPMKHLAPATLYGGKFAKYLEAADPSTQPGKSLDDEVAATRARIRAEHAREKREGAQA